MPMFSVLLQLTILLLFLQMDFLVGSGGLARGVNEVRCAGTSDPYSNQGQRRGLHYRDLSRMYENCSLVEGNLELTWLKDRSLDLGFLKAVLLRAGWGRWNTEHTSENAPTRN